MLRSCLARGKKNFFNTISRISCLDSGAQMMNPALSMSTAGTSHLGKSAHSFKSQTSALLKYTSPLGHGASHKMGINRAISSAGSRGISINTECLSGTRLSHAGGRNGRIFASGGDSGGSNGSGGGRGDGNNDGDESSGGWFGRLWILYLAQLDKNPVRAYG